MFTMQLVYTKLSESSKRVEIKSTVDVYHVDPGCGSNRRFVLEAKTIKVRLKPDGTNYINTLDVKLNPPQIISIIGTEPTEFQPNPALVTFSDGKQMKANWILKPHTEQEAAIVRQERLIAAMTVTERTSKQLDPYCHGYREAGDYAGVSERTVKNWKARDWLRIEQMGGRKGGNIRILKSDLDKCRKPKREPK